MSVAVIGAGAWGRHLVRILAELGALDAVVDPNESVRAEVAARYPNVACYDDLQPVLETDCSPAVAIATPVPTHYPVAREALLAGKDVFVEKPLACSANEAEELWRLAERGRRTLMVGHLLLYQPAVQWIKAYLDSGVLGRVHSFHQERLNLGQARSAENALWSLGVHDVAVLLYLVGSPPAEVRTAAQSVLQPGIEDDVYLHLEFPGGQRAHLHATWLWPEKRRRLVVVASDGMLVYEEGEQRVLVHKRSIGRDLVSKDGGWEEAFRGEGEPLRLEMQHFLARLEDRKPPLSDGRSGAEVVRVLEAAFPFSSLPRSPIAP